MTPHFIAALIIAAILYVSATVLLLRAYGTTEDAAAPPTAATQPVQTTRHQDMHLVQMQGITTALMDIGRLPSRNPYPPGSQARAVWFGGYVMAEARARRPAATPNPQRQA